MASNLPRMSGGAGVCAALAEVADLERRMSWVPTYSVMFVYVWASVIRWARVQAGPHLRRGDGHPPHGHPTPV